MRFAPFILFFIFIISGCTSLSPHDTYVNEQHLAGKVSIDSNGSFSEYHSSLEEPDNFVKAHAYLEKGIALSRTVCFEHLDSLSASDNNLAFSKNEFGALVVLATGIMGLNGASDDSFARLALGAATLNTTADLYTSHYLLGPDSDVIVEMIKTAMNTAEAESKNRLPTNFVQAYTLLESYSRLCSGTTIRRLVREVIKQAQFEAKAPVENLVARNALTDIAIEFDRSSLSDSQYYGLYWSVSEQPTDEDFVKAINLALGDLADSVKDLDLVKRIKIKNLFERVRSLVVKYKQEINKAKQAIIEATKPEVQPEKVAAMLFNIYGINEDSTLALLSSELESEKMRELMIEKVQQAIITNIPTYTSVLMPETGIQISVK